MSKKRQVSACSPKEGRREIYRRGLKQGFVIASSSSNSTRHPVNNNVLLKPHFWLVNAPKRSKKLAI